MSMTRPVDMYTKAPSGAVRTAAVAAGLVALLLLAPAPRATAQQPATEGGEQAAADAGQHEGMTNPYLGQQEAIEEGERIFRGRCVGCHWSPLRGPKLFRTELSAEEFLETVISGRKGERGTMPRFGYILSPDDVWKVHAFVMSRDRL